MKLDRSGTGTGDSSQPSISAEGQSIAFVTRARDLGGTPSTNASTFIYIYDSAAKSNRLVNFSGSSLQPRTSGDGKRLVFLGGGQLHMHDPNSGVASRVFPTGFAQTTEMSLSWDGSQLVADVRRTGQPTQIYWRDGSGSNRLASVATDGVSGGNGSSSSPGISADGRFAVFTSHASNLVLADANGTNDVFLRDLQAGTTTLVSVRRGGTGPGDGPSGPATISGDGRYAVFRSAASDLVADDDNGVPDVFVRDMRRGTTRLLSRRPDTAAPGNERPGQILLVSSNGNTVLFASFASDLAPNDFNFAPDIFSAALPPDVDADGLDDSWEQANFGALTLDGSADSDRDGLSDRDEFSAGTSPKNPDSALKFTRAGQGVTLTWPSEKSHRYRVRVSASLAPALWTDLTPSLSGTGGPMIFTDATLSSELQRYYQLVVVLP